MLQRLLSSGDRFWQVVANTARQLVVPAANLLAAYLVVSAAGNELWGSFVVHMVVVTLAVSLLSWGNRDYLLREASLGEQPIATLWQESLLSRGLGLVVPVLVLLLLGSSGRLLMWLLLWLLAAFVHQSLDVVVLFAKRFTLALAAGLLGLTATVTVLLASGGSLDEETVVMAYALGVALRAAVLLAGLAPLLFDRWAPRLAHRHITMATPFFLIAISGLLVSRVDLYVVALVLPLAEVARYQVMINLFVAMQSLCAFILMPFVRELYQSPDQQARQGSWWLFLFGIVMVAATMPAAWLILDRAFDFQLPWLAFALGALIVLPVFRYSPWIFLLFKHGRERVVVVVSFAGAAVNLVVTAALLPGVGLLGALLGAASSQWLILLAYAHALRRPEGAG